MIIDLKNSSMSLEEAINKASSNDTILLDNKEYFEKITVDKSLTLIGMENTIINYDASHGTIMKDIHGGNGVKTYGTTGSSTFRILKNVNEFTCKNITFKNCFDRTNKKNGQAVAFKAECNKLLLENCKFLSHQDTLYLDYGNDMTVKDCYIEGDVDFVFGSANAVFDNCTFVSLNNDINTAYVFAPDTFQSNDLGFKVTNSKFITKDDVKTYIGRAWYPSLAPEEVFPKLSISNSSFNGNFVLELITMHEGDPLRHDLVLENITLNGKNI